MIEYRIAQSSDRESILELLKCHFYPFEPMNRGWIMKGDVPEDTEMSLEGIENGFCIIAIDETKNMLVGASLNAIDKPEYTDWMYEESERTQNPKWAEYLRFYADCDNAAKIFEKYQTNSSFHVHCLVVHNDYRGQSVGLNLIRETHQLGAALGYKISTVNCSNFYTKKIAMKLNMECVFELAYEDCRGKNGQKIIQCDPPHTHISTFAKVIKDYIE